MRLRLNSLTARLFLGTCVPLVLFLGMALMALVAIQRLHDALRHQEGDYQIIAEVGRLQYYLSNMRLAQQGHVLQLELNSHSLQEDYRHGRAAFLRTADDLGGLLEGRPDQVARLERIVQLESEWHSSAEEVDREHVLRSRQSPQDSAVAVQDFLRRTEPQTRAIEQLVDELIAVELDWANGVHAQIGWQTQESLWTIGLTAPLAMGLMLLVAWRSARSVARPLNRLREAAGQVIAGRFQMLDPAGPNELIELVTRFNHMGLTLAERTTSLQAQTERYQRYIGATSHILWSAGPSGKIVGDIPTWRAFTGQAESEVRGDGWFDAIHPDDRHATRQRWEDVVRARGIFEQEFRLRSAAGEYRDFACRGVPILNADDTVREWIGTCTDVTERRRQAALQVAKEEAEAANRAKSEFLAKMSHELRTPLNAVIGMSKMLATGRFGPLNPKQADYISDILHAGEHLLGLINDILDLTKVDAGRMEVRTEPFQFGEAVETLLSTLRPLADQRGVKLSFQPPATEDVLVTDLSRLRQILYNLLSNAIKFTPKKGRVAVACNWAAEPCLHAPSAPAETAQAVRVTVSDTGTGIAPEDQELIWSEFRQLRPSPEGFDGTGLGLALVRRLVHLLGGQIGLESAVNQGSAFTVVLPRRWKPAECSATNA